MSDWFDTTTLQEVITPERLLSVVKAITILVVGLIVARLVSGAVGRAVEARADRQQAMLFRRFLYYGLFLLVVATTLHQLGFQLGVLLGAAGVLTVAVGFASQTSASNLISGLFLIMERPFVIGDIIRIDDVTGEVLSIDLLSVKLRTFDNLFVRIPNESIIKSRMTTLTAYPIRRVDVKVGVAYKEDLTKVSEILMQVADDNPLCLDEPAPRFFFTGFGDSSLDIQFSVWGQRQNYVDLKNTIQQGIKEAFDNEGVEIPFPHRTLYTGAVTDPFPVRVNQAKG